MCRNQWKSFAAVHIHVITSWYIMCSFMIFISVSFTSCCWGPVCFDFSMMGSRRQMDDPNFCTHTAYFENVACTHDLNIIENVPEYGVDIVRAALGPRFDIKAVKIDPRILGLGVARSRIYIVAIHKSKLKWKAKFSVGEFMDALTSQVVLGCTDYYWRKLPRQNLSECDEPWLILSRCVIAVYTSNWLHVNYVICVKGLKW